MMDIDTPQPSDCCAMRQKAGEEPGNEARALHNDTGWSNRSAKPQGKMAPC